MRQARNEAGVVAIVTTLALSTFLLGVAALAVDLGRAYLRQNDLQALADRLALAGAKGLPTITEPEGAIDQLTTTLAAICGNGEESGEVCGTGAGQWTDGDPGNGEATFFADSDTDGRVGPADAVSDLATPSQALRILLPPTTVQFGLAGALGFEEARIQRSATARIGTALGSGILPFALTPEGVASGRFCVQEPTSEGTTTLTTERTHTGTPPVTDPPPPGGSCETSSPVVQLVRQDAGDPATALENNVRSGPEVTLLPNPGTVTEGTLGCTGSILSGTTGCLNLVAPGQFSEALRRGLLETGGGRPGRLIGDTGNGVESTNGYQVDATSLFESPHLLDPQYAGSSGQPLRTLLTQGTPARPGNRGWITSAAVRSHRLAVVPVIDPEPIGLGNGYRIASFRHVWIDSETGDRGLLWRNGRLVGFEGYVVDPGYLPAVTSGSATVGPFLGADLPKEALLVADPDASPQ